MPGCPNGAQLGPEQCYAETVPDEKQEDASSVKVIKFKAGHMSTAYLDALVKTGLMGKDRTAVVRTIVLEGLRGQIRDGIIKKLE